MGILDYMRSSRKGSGSAALAKDRLQIVVAHQRRERNRPAYLTDLHNDILKVVRRYVKVDDDAINVQIDRRGDCEILELNIVLPEEGYGR